MESSRHVVTSDGEEVSLPLKEFDLLSLTLRSTRPGALTGGQ